MGRRTTARTINSCGTYKSRGQCTGARDSPDATHFQERALQKATLFELHQDQHTFKGGRTLSKLDLTYWHACDRMDRTVECVATRLPCKLSDHRPVIVARRSVNKLIYCDSGSRALPARTLEHESWAYEVTQQY